MILTIPSDGSLYGRCGSCGDPLPPPSSAAHWCSVRIVPTTTGPTLIGVGRIILWPLKLALVAMLTLTACSLSPSASVIDALAKDPATVCLTVTSIYGTGKFYRTAAPQATVQCSQDGMTVKSGPPTTP